MSEHRLLLSCCGQNVASRTGYCGNYDGVLRLVRELLPVRSPARIILAS